MHIEIKLGWDAKKEVTLSKEEMELILLWRRVYCNELCGRESEVLCKTCKEVGLLKRKLEATLVEEKPCP